METVRNLDGKRVCNISTDHRVIIIAQRGFITRITACKNGTLKIENLTAK